MEIEAKFVVPHRATLQRLSETTELGGFQLTPGSVKTVQDSYRDTAGRTMYQSGYACRIRHKAGTSVATLKGLGRVVGGVHERAEYEVALDTGEPPHDWPQSEARDLILSLCRDQEIPELFAVTQERTTRSITQGNRTVAEMSLDVVHFHTGTQTYDSFEVEVELLEEGTRDDLQKMAHDLENNWHLQPQPLSKFERGLELLDGSSAPALDSLSTEERALLQEIAQTGKPMHARRAQLLLLDAQGLKSTDIAPHAGISDRQVRHWVQHFREDRMLIFPGRAIAAASAAIAEKSMPPVSADTEPLSQSIESELTPLTESEGAVPQVTVKPRTSVQELCQRYAVDEARVRHIQTLSLAIFDAMAHVHTLSSDRRELLRMAAALHRVGFTNFPMKLHSAGRDIILAHEIDGLQQTEQDMLACIVAFQRGQITEKRLKAEKTYRRLPAGVRREALVLASILRIAAGLDHSQSQTTHIVPEDIVTVPGDSPDRAKTTFVPIRGAFTEEDSSHAQRRTDAWNSLFDMDLRIVPSESIDVFVRTARRPPPPDWTARLSDTRVLPDDPMSEAGRKVLLLHFSRMLEHEEGTRLGEDIEELHDMRVATRRMRSAFDVFAPYFDPKILRPFVKDLKCVGRALGRVRDLDVFMQKAQRYVDQTAQEHHMSLTPLLETWKMRRELERVEMSKTLDDKAYRRFVQSFGTFLATEGAGALPLSPGRPTAYRVYQLVPALIYGRYEVIRGYEPLLADAPIKTLHALRIEFKRLRYALEFFREVLGSEVEDVIKEVVTVQDHLGDLNDADVACSLLISFLQEWIQEDRRERIRIDGVTRYLLDQQLELRTLIDTFPQTWQHFNHQKLRRNLAIAISVL